MFTEPCALHLPRMLLTHWSETMKTKNIVLSLLTSLCMAAVPLAAPAADEHSLHHHAMPASTDAAPLNVPPLELLMPRTGDTIGKQVAVVLSTPANLDDMTMGAAKIGVHLHIELDGMALMPTRQQLIDLGSKHYLFLFDLPAKPGPNTIRLYWSDAQHRTLDATVRAVTVQVRG